MDVYELLTSPARRVGFYTAAIGREAVPRCVWRQRKQRVFEEVARKGLDGESRARVNYYNRLMAGTQIGVAPPLSEVPRKKGYYYFDLRRDALHFEPDLRLHTLFGDVKYVPDLPSVVKSRPIGPNNANSVLLKLNRLRHYQLHRDPVPFEKKRPHAVWRGAVHNDIRRLLIEAHGTRLDHDVGHVGGRQAIGAPKGWLSVRRQMDFRYILSVEGNDVATNTKWIMWSNSICLMPEPRFETWFMEGRLEPFVHYVPVAKDFSDLDERIGWCEDNPREARRIVANAKAHVASFTNRSRETLIAVLVLQKYFECTGQLEPEPFSSAIFD